MRAQDGWPRVVRSGAVVGDFIVDDDSAPYVNHPPAEALALYYPTSQRLCEFVEGPSGTSVRVSIVPDIRFIAAAEARKSGVCEEVEILAAEPDSPLWLRIREPHGRTTRLMPLSGQRRMPWAFGRSVSGYGLADGAVLMLETELWRASSQLVIAHPNGRVERHTVAETGTLRAGWMLGTIPEAGALRVFARRVGLWGAGARVDLGLVPATTPGAYPCHFHVRGAGEALFMAIAISHGPEPPQVATTFCLGGRWSPLTLHAVDSLELEVGYARGVGRVVWKDDNMFSGTGSRDIATLTVWPDGGVRSERHPPLPASAYLDFEVVPLGDRVLALSLDEAGLMARLAATADLGEAREELLVALPEGLWSFTAHARGEQVIVVVCESESRRQFAVRIDAEGTVTAVAIR